MSDERQTFDLDDLHEAYTEKSICDEASRQVTVPNGNYPITIVKASGYFAADQSGTPGRRMIDFQVKLAYEGKSLTRFIRTSIEPYRVLVVAGNRTVINDTHENYSADLPLDGPSKKWAKMVVCVDPKNELSQTLQAKALVDSTLSCYVMEGFKDDADGMHFYKTEGERKALAEAGFVPNNFFTGFKPWKA